MKTYDFVALIILPLVLIQFSIDYLSDSQITTNETRIGILQLIHHLITKITFIGSIFTLFLVNDIKYISLGVIILIIVQLGFAKNNDHCWYTRMVNELIDKNKPNRKWRSDWESFIKHYIRGDKWAYSDRFNNDATMELTMVNIIYILIFIKLILRNSKNN
jgi:hypothetical protein